MPRKSVSSISVRQRNLLVDLYCRTFKKPNWGEWLNWLFGFCEKLMWLFKERCLLRGLKTCLSLMTTLINGLFSCCILTPSIWWRPMHFLLSIMFLISMSNSKTTKHELASKACPRTKHWIQSFLKGTATFCKTLESSTWLHFAFFSACAVLSMKQFQKTLNCEIWETFGSNN
jgi:hypothetical protein